MRYMGMRDQNELFDINNDPNEIHNLTNNLKYADIAKKLAGELFDWLQDSNKLQIPVKRTIKHSD
jgi:N-acetylglucosamine-6-sulfatase